jgi:GDPmannose 4,6-dehydratase
MSLPIKVALITGIAGQDGSYLAELLLEKNYIVYGILRRSSIIRTERIDHIFHKLKLVYGDVTDASAIHSVIHKMIQENPEAEQYEIYNLAAQSHVQVSFELPSYTAQVDAFGVTNILETIRALEPGVKGKVRFYQASTSELFGKILEKPQKETTPFNPTSPYAIAKHYAHQMVKLYREAYGLFCCAAVLFNHESPRRGETFVTRKITIALGNILRGKQDCLKLGNLDSLRDWGHAKDYVRAQWMILQQEQPKDYIIATGEQHSVREFVELCFRKKGIELKWEGSGLDEKGVCVASGRVYVKVDSKYFRPSEVDDLLGDSSLAQKELGWKPEMSFQDLVDEMVEADCS